MSTPKYKVSYFNIRGLAEHIRMLLLDNGIPFEDDQFPRDEWYNVRKAKSTFGQCPMLEDGAWTIAQSGTIMRHLARKHDLYGATEGDKILLDMLADACHDLRLKYYQIVYREYEKKADFVAKVLPVQLAGLEKVMSTRPAASGPCILGEAVAYTDYVLWELLACLVLHAEKCLEAFPALAAFYKDFPAHRPALNKYLASDQRKNTPVNNTPNV